MNTIDSNTPIIKPPFSDLKEKLPEPVFNLFSKLTSQEDFSSFLKTKEEKLIRILPGKDLLSAQKALAVYKKTVNLELSFLDETATLKNKTTFLLLFKEISSELKRREHVIENFLKINREKPETILDNPNLRSKFIDYLKQQSLTLDSLKENPIETQRYYLHSFFHSLADEILSSESSLKENATFNLLREIAPAKKVTQVENLKGDEAIKKIDKLNTRNSILKFVAIATAATAVCSAIIVLNILFFPMALFYTLMALSLLGLVTLVFGKGSLF